MQIYHTHVYQNHSCTNGYCPQTHHHILYTSPVVYSITIVFPSTHPLITNYLLFSPTLLHLFLFPSKYFLVSHHSPTTASPCPSQQLLSPINSLIYHLLPLSLIHHYFSSSYLVYPPKLMRILHFVSYQLPLSTSLQYFSSPLPPLSPSRHHLSTPVPSPLSSTTARCYSTTTTITFTPTTNHHHYHCLPHLSSHIHFLPWCSVVRVV